MRIVDEEDWELVSDNPRTGCITWRKCKHTPQGFVWTYKYDYYCDETVETNLQQRNMAMRGWKGDMHHVAAIPAGMAFNGYFAEALAQHDETSMKKWLNDPDNRGFRTKEGTL